MIHTSSSAYLIPLRSSLELLSGKTLSSSIGVIEFGGKEETKVERAVAPPQFENRGASTSSAFPVVVEEV
ncbi:hypothetical protein ACOSQ4_028072 [Xanthoceras sorbifolium]